MKLAKDLKATRLNVLNDSLLIMNQIDGDYATKYV